MTALKSTWTYCEAPWWDPKHIEAADALLSRHSSTQEFADAHAEGMIPLGTFRYIVERKTSLAAAYLLRVPANRLHGLLEEVAQIEDYHSSESTMLRVERFICHWMIIRFQNDNEESERMWKEDYAEARSGLAGRSSSRYVIEAAFEEGFYCQMLLNNSNLTREDKVNLSYALMKHGRGLALESQTFTDMRVPQMSYAAILRSEGSSKYIADHLRRHPEIDLSTFKVLSENWAGSFEDLVNASREFSPSA